MIASNVGSIHGLSEEIKLRMASDKVTALSSSDPILISLLYLSEILTEDPGLSLLTLFSTGKWRMNRRKASVVKMVKRKSKRKKK